MSLLFAIGFLPLLLGHGLLLNLGTRASRGVERLVRLAVAWTLGFFVIGLVLWGLAWFGLSSAGWLQLASCSALAATTYALAWLRRKPAQAQAIPSTSPAKHSHGEWWLFWGALVLTTASLTDRANLSRLDPILSGDEAAIWTASARGLSDSEGYTAKYGQSIATYITHPDYPSLNPLWQQFVFSMEPAPEPFNGRLPMQAAALALVLLVGGSLASRTRPALAALAVLMLGGLHGSASFDLVKTAYSDGLVALGLTLATVSWFAWHASGRTARLVLTAAGLGLAIFSKNEGLMHALGFIGAALGAWLFSLKRSQDQRKPDALSRSSASPVHLLLLLALIPFALTGFVKTRYGLEGDLMGSANVAGAPIWITIPRQFAERAPQVAKYIAEYFMSSPAAGGPIVLAFALLLVTAPRRLFSGPFLAPTLMLLASSLGFALIFIGSVHHLGRGPAAELWHLDTALVRVYGQLLPVTLLLLGLAFSKRPVR